MKRLRNIALLGCGLVGAVTLSACGSSSSSDTTTTTFTQRTVPSTSTTRAPATTTTTQALTISAFQTPNGNIVCSLVTSGSNVANCQTNQPPQVVEMTSTGTYTTSTAVATTTTQQTLAYGSSTTANGVTCLSAAAGVTCTVSGGAGFTLTKGGVYAVTSSSTTATTAVPQALTIPAFLSPTQNISCELQNSGDNVAYCQTTSPAQTVSMTATGTLTKGTAIGNPGVGTPILPYGSSTTANGVTCNSLSSGVTCKLSNGQGFTINNSGIYAVS